MCVPHENPTRTGRQTRADGSDEDWLADDEDLKDCAGQMELGGRGGGGPHWRLRERGLRSKTVPWPLVPSTLAAGGYSDPEAQSEITSMFSFLENSVTMSCMHSNCADMICSFASVRQFYYAKLNAKFILFAYSRYLLPFSLHVTIFKLRLCISTLVVCCVCNTLRITE